MGYHYCFSLVLVFTLITFHLITNQNSSSSKHATIFTESGSIRKKFTFYLSLITFNCGFCLITFPAFCLCACDHYHSGFHIQTLRRFNYAVSNELARPLQLSTTPTRKHREESKMRHHFPYLTSIFLSGILASKLCFKVIDK